jgi:hypothetical protein
MAPIWPCLALDKQE